MWRKPRSDAPGIFFGNRGANAESGRGWIPTQRGNLITFRALLGAEGLQADRAMDPENLTVRYPKPRGNTVLTVALTLCFGGLFVLLAVIAAFAAVLVAGEKTVLSNFIYLFAVLLYLGAIVGALVAAGLNLDLPRWTSP